MANDDARPSSFVGNAMRTSTPVEASHRYGSNHWRAGCREIGTSRVHSGRGRRKRTSTRGTSSAAYFTLRGPRRSNAPGLPDQALKGPKRHQVVSGYWCTLSILAAYCRVRSYLLSARGHHVRAIDAIHNALTGNPWLPTPATA